MTVYHSCASCHRLTCGATGNVDLLPCPFCGGDAGLYHEIVTEVDCDGEGSLIDSEHQTFAARCRNGKCGCRTPDCVDQQTASDIWNGRVAS